MKNIEKQTKFVTVWGGILKLRRGGGEFPPLKALKKNTDFIVTNQSLLALYFSCLLPCAKMHKAVSLFVCN